MISMIWISQAALRFADTDWFAPILISLIFMWIVMSFNEEGGVTGVFQYLIAGLFYFCTLSKLWNNNPRPKNAKKAVKSKKENKKNKESPPPPVIVENPKKKQKKGKRPTKKSFGKENSEPTVTKKEAKMFLSWDTCKRLNRDTKSIYDQLHKHILTDTELKMNRFPYVGYQPVNEVAADDCSRKCCRCNTIFTIYNGLHLSDCECRYHPQKLRSDGFCRPKVYGCCNKPYGSDPCTTSNTHVTLQHQPRALSKTPSRRHVKKDLQHSIFSLDCEMCYTTDGLEVVRVALVNIDGLTVYDGFVKPNGKILDYNTMYSGVHQGDLQNVTVTLADVKQILSSFITEDTILVGHALNNDLAALGIIHNTIVDTSVLYADPVNPFKKMALKTLASTYLGTKIQDSVSGHDCIVDARSALQLALLKVPEYDPSLYPEPTQYHCAHKQPSTATDAWRQEQQQPLTEIQNFNGGFRPGMYNFWESGRAQFHGPNSFFTKLHMNSAHMPQFISPCLRESY